MSASGGALHTRKAMHKTVREDIRERERLNELIRSFGVLDEWTPAMGALLFSGVIPVVSSHDIPKEAYQLKDPTLRATGAQLRDARCLLDRWLEENVEEDDIPEGVHYVSPSDFFIWCKESHATAPDWKRPAWLNYIFAIYEGPSTAVAAPPTPAPPHLVRSAAALETLVSAALDSGALPVSASSAQSSESDAFDLTSRGMCQHVVTKRGRICPIEKEIRLAQERVEDKLNARLVWGELRRMAEAGDSSRLQRPVAGDNSLPYLDPITMGRRNYTFNALKRFIDPRKKEKRVKLRGS